ncbi:hypothetical protein [Streptomyces lasiicapitis]|uniref:hypothetical protein n=1 Tax=Streptomyces lasiicapitis TaxID=1923961 RepID=UPI0036CF6733
MGLFSRKKFDQMPTAEEQYAAEQQRAAQANAAYRAVQTEASRRWKQRQAEAEERRKKVLKPGELHLKGDEVHLKGEWTWAPGSMPVEDLTRTHFGSNVAGLTVKDLHALATNHGPDCRCGLGR